MAAMEALSFLLAHASQMLASSLTDSRAPPFMGSGFLVASDSSGHAGLPTMQTSVSSSMRLSWKTRSRILWIRESTSSAVAPP